MYLRRLQSCFLVMVEDVLSDSDWFLEAVDLGKVVSFVVESVLVRGIVLEEEVEVEFLEVLWDLCSWLIHVLKWWSLLLAPRV